MACEPQALRGLGTGHDFGAGRSPPLSPVGPSLLPLQTLEDPMWTLFVSRSAHWPDATRGSALGRCWRVQTHNSWLLEMCFLKLATVGAFTPRKLADAVNPGPSPQRVVIEHLAVPLSRYLTLAYFLGAQKRAAIFPQKVSVR